MAKKIKSLNLKDIRPLTISLETVAGNISMFYAFINGVKVIQGDGTKKRSWSGNIPTSQITLKIRVVGIGSAQYKLGIDLPGTADDQNLTLTLQGGYHEIEITL